MERHNAGTARVIPVILRHVANWHDAPFGKLQAFADVARHIRTAVDELRNPQ